METACSLAGKQSGFEMLVFSLAWPADLCVSSAQGTMQAGTLFLSPAAAASLGTVCILSQQLPGAFLIWLWQEIVHKWKPN